MKCPFCGEDTTKVIDSRPSDDNTAIRRRRMCEVCNRRFTSKKGSDKRGLFEGKIKNWNCYGMP